MTCASRRKVPGCVPDVRIEVPRAAWSKHWRQCVWLTCPTPTRDTLASRCSKRIARKLPRCGTGARAKSTYCDLSSFGPALFEIWWPDIYLGGPYGPVKGKMYWPGGLKSAPGQCLCRGLRQCPVDEVFAPFQIGFYAQCWSCFSGVDFVLFIFNWQNELCERAQW